MHRWDPTSAAWVRSRPGLNGRLLQPSNQVASQPDLVDVFPSSDRIVDLASVDFTRRSCPPSVNGTLWQRRVRAA